MFWLFMSILQNSQPTEKLQEQCNKLSHTFHLDSATVYIFATFEFFVCVSVCMLCLCMRINVCVFAHVYIYSHVDTYVHTYKYLYAHTYTHSFKKHLRIIYQLHNL